MIEIQRAVSSDAAFIATATVQAERAHTGRGIWDSLLGEDGRILEGGVLSLEEVIKSDSSSHIYFGNFFVARTPEGRAVATCSSYTYPEVDLTATMIALGKVVHKHLGWTAEEYECHKARLNFLSDSFPSDLPYVGSWFLETIYTDPEYRGQGLSKRLIGKCLDAGRANGSARSMLVVASGNDAAINLYCKLGFALAGTAYSTGAEQELGCQGFDIMIRLF